MKRVAFAGIFCSLLLILGACGTTDDKQPKVDNSTSTSGTSGSETAGTANEGTASNNGSNAADHDDMAAKWESLGYREFEVEVTYPDRSEYEAEIERKHDGTLKSKIEDSVNNQESHGQDAFDELYPMIEKTGITQDTPKEDAISKTLDALGLDAGYEKFELEITFADGTEIEYEDRK